MQPKVLLSLTWILVLLDLVKSGYEDDLVYDQKGFAMKEVEKLIEYEGEASQPFDSEKGMNFVPNSGNKLCNYGSVKVGRPRKTQFSITFAAYKVYLGHTSPVYNMLRCPATWGDFHIKRIAASKYVIYVGPTEAENFASYQSDEGTSSSVYGK